MSLQKPALDPQKVEPRSRSSYPEPYRSRVLPLEAPALGEALGLTPVLRTQAGEQQLTAGMCAGFAAGSTDGHHLINRSERPASFLVVSNRDPEDGAHYPDPDVDLMWSPPHARKRMTRRDGTPC